MKDANAIEANCNDGILAFSAADFFSAAMQAPDHQTRDDEVTEQASTLCFVPLFFLRCCTQLCGSSALLLSCCSPHAALLTLLFSRCSSSSAV